MPKLFLVTLITLAAAAAATAQDMPTTTIAPAAASASDTQNMGKAPTVPNGIGRLDARVFDGEGNPVKDAKVELESNRTDGYICEAWNTTDERGVAVLPPTHMGRLKLIVKAKGYKTQKLIVPASELNEPVRVTLLKK